MNRQTNDKLNTAECPHCSKPINLDELWSSTLIAKHRAEIEREITIEAAEELSVLQTEIRAKELENQSLKKNNDRETKAKVSLAVQQAMLEKDSQFDKERQEWKQKDEKTARQVAEMQKNASQGSQKIQGNAGEGLVKDRLESWFPYDNIIPIKPGAQGPDVIHSISVGHYEGKILVESKNTANWQNIWVTKAKEELTSHGCVVGVIVSNVLPKGKERAFQQDSIWICLWHEFETVVRLLRQAVDNANRLRLAHGTDETEGRKILEHLTGGSFASSIGAIVAPIADLKKQLEDEKRALQRQWNAREIHINSMLKSASILVAEIEAISGNNLPEIKGLPSIQKLISGEK